MDRTPLLERLAAFALPESERDVILADLREESPESGSGDPSGSPRSIAWQTLKIAARYHAECYREPGDQWRIFAVLAAAGGLLWIVPAATARTFAGTDVFTDPITLAIVNMWRASHLTSPFAAGLLVGRITILPEHTNIARWHVMALLAASCVAINGPGAGSIAPLLLVASAWLGDQSRRAVVTNETHSASH